MSTTDTRTGFRLPWSAERDTPDEPGPSVSVDEAAGTAGDPDGTSTPGDWPSADLGGRAADADDPAPSGVDDGEVPAPEPASAPHRRPTKFLADLTTAMRTAAEAARAQALEQFQAETTSVIGAIHDASAGEVVGLRARADEDVAAVREWSKAEIARIREETDARIARRRQTLEGELEAHAADVERRIERVQGAVAGYEGEMAAFFERLFAESDPARFAAMAETMPEPPALAEVLPEVHAEPVVDPAPAAIEQGVEEGGEPDGELVGTDAPARADWVDLDAAEADRRAHV